MDEFAEALDWARGVCLALPEAYEEEAWVGTRWMVRRRTFAYLLEIVDGYPPSFAAAARTDGPATVLTFRAGAELAAVLAGPGSFGPLWNRDDVGIRLAEHPGPGRAGRADRGQLPATRAEDPAPPARRLTAPPTPGGRTASGGPMATCRMRPTPIALRLAWVTHSSGEPRVQATVPAYPAAQGRGRPR